MSNISLSKQQMSIVRKSRAVKEARNASKQIMLELIATRHAEVRRKQKLSQHNKQLPFTLQNRYLQKKISILAMKNEAYMNARSKTPKMNKLKQRPRTCNQEAPHCDYTNIVLDDEEVKRPPRKIKQDIWSMIYEKDIQEMKNEQINSKKMNAQSIASTRSILRKQQEERMRKKELEQKESLDYHLEMVKKANAMEILEKKNEEDRIKRHLRNVELGRLSILEKQQAEEKKKNNKIRNERILSESLEKASQLEKMNLERKKLDQKLKMEMVLKENKLHQDQKRAERKKLQEEECRLNEEYKKRLQQQHNARDIAFKKSLELQHNRSSALHQYKCDNGRKCTELFERQYQERIEKENKMAEAEALKKIQMERDQYRVLEAQKRDNQQRIEATKRETLLYRQKLNADAMEAKIEDERKKKQMKERNFRHNELVKAQISEACDRRSKPDRFGMSSAEVAMNSKLLKKFELLQPGTGKLIIEDA